MTGRHPHRDACVSLDGVPDVVPRLATLVVEAAEALSTPPGAVSSAVVHLEPLERTREGPWLGILAAGTDRFAPAESEVRAWLGEVRTRLVATCPGVRALRPAPGATGTIVAVRRPAGLPGLPLVFAPFVVTDPGTLAELSTVTLPDAALPAPVLRVPVE